MPLIVSEGQAYNMCRTLLHGTAGHLQTVWSTLRVPPFISLKQAHGKRGAINIELTKDNIGHLVGAADFSQCSAQTTQIIFNQYKKDTGGM